MLSRSSPMAIALTPLHPTLGAEVRGVDLTHPVLPEVFAEIEAAFNRYGILVFPEQPVTDGQQLAFSRLFGPLEVNPNYAGAKLRVRPDIADISNLDAEGRVLARDDRRNLFNIGNLAHRQLVQAYPGEMLAAVGPRDSNGGRRDRIRRSAGGVGRAARAEKVPPRRARCRTQHLPLAQPDRLCRFQRRNLQGTAAGAAGSGPPSSRIGPHQPLSRLARLAHHRLTGRGGEGADRGADRVCDPAAIRLSAPLDGRRS